MREIFCLFFVSVGFFIICFFVWEFDVCLLVKVLLMAKVNRLGRYY